MDTKFVINCDIRMTERNEITDVTTMNFNNRRENNMQCL